MRQQQMAHLVRHGVGEHARPSERWRRIEELCHAALERDASGLTGRTPFAGDHPSAIAHAAERATPVPLTAVRTGVPMELERVVDRALARSPDDRYQTAADLLSELRRINRDSASRPSAVTTGERRLSPRQMLRKPLLWAGVAASLALVTLTVLVTSRRGADGGLPRLTNPVQVAASIGEERLPSWPPDGSILTYQSDQAGNNDIWITQIGGSAINRTADFSGGDEAPRVSPDGRQIAFWSAREGGGLQAESLYLEALAIQRRVLGDEHPEVASTLENLGGVCYRTKRYDEALRLLDQVLAMRRKKLGDSHTAVGRTFANIGTVKSAAKDYTGASHR